MRALFQASGLLLCLLISLHSAASDACPAVRAKRVEEQLPNVESWATFVQIYEHDGVCDRSALSYAFTQAVAQLATAPGGLRAAAKSSARHPWLKAVILRHLRSEAMTEEDAERIASLAHQSCPPENKKFCSDVLKAVGR